MIFDFVDAVVLVKFIGGVAGVSPAEGVAEDRRAGDRGRLSPSNNYQK